MKILLIGKTGQLGADIIKLAKHDIVAPSRNELDLRNKESLKFIDKIKPDLIINTAAYHQLPQCEINPAEAFWINSIAVYELATLSKNTGSVFITLSTDYVFDGKKKTPYIESDSPHPLQVYGISKFAGELAAMSAWEKTFVIRTCGLYGYQGCRSKGGNFVENRIRDSQKSLLEISNDEVVCPTSSQSLAMAILKLIESGLHEPGIYHLVSEGQCSWYEFTCAVFEILKIKTPVIPINRGGCFENVFRPSYSVLSNTKAKSLNIVLPHWRESLQNYLCGRSEKFRCD